MPTTKKKITTILREMIEEAKVLGKKPEKIELTEKDYQRLFEELKKHRVLYSPAGYEATPVGIVYYPKPMPIKIKEFMGLPVKIGEQTMVLWLNKMTKTKTNKWVDEFDRKIDPETNDSWWEWENWVQELNKNDIKDFISNIITQTQQETLEILTEVMCMADAGREDDEDCNDIFNYLEKSKFGKIIKNKMEEGK